MATSRLACVYGHLLLITIAGAVGCSKSDSTSRNAGSTDTAAPAMALNASPDSGFQLCLTKEIGPGLAMRAQSRAESENAKNSINPNALVFGITEGAAKTTASHGVWAALASSKRWAPGRSLRVRFLNGDALLQQRVFDAATEWQRFANVQFVRSGDANSEIRVLFTGDNASWSMLGTDAQFRPANAHTMQFGWLSASSRNDVLQAVVLHEFGHALGLIHEHQQPAAAIPWDTAAVYSWYAQRGWDKADVDAQVFRRASRTETQYSQFDRASIMLYPVPPELTKGLVSVGWNTQLSPTDMLYIECWYHKGSAPASTCPADAR